MFKKKMRVRGPKRKKFDSQSLFNASMGYSYTQQGLSGLKNRMSSNDPNTSSAFTSTIETLGADS